MINSKLTVSVLARSTSNPTVPEGTRLIKVDYNDHAELVKALKGQDALVSCLGPLTIADKIQKPLFAAAAEAGVKRILPSDFGKLVGKVIIMVTG